MKLNCKQFYWVAALTLTISLAGCGLPRSRDFKPLESGYATEAHYRGLIHVSGRLELQHKNGRNQVIWPDIEEVTVNGDTAVFLAWLRGESGAGAIRLFAYQPPGPVVDITRQALELGAKQKGQRFADLPKSSTMSTLKKEQGGVKVGVAFVDWADSTFELDWNQISIAIRDVKANGKPQEDARSQTLYLNWQ